MRSASRCPACDAPATALLWRGAGRSGVRSLHRCGGCGAAFVQPLPEPSVLASWYGQAYFEAFYGGSREAATGRDVSFLDATTPRLGPGVVRMLDVGCGVGDLCVAASRRGWDVTGLEASPVAAGRAASRGVQVIHGEAASLLGNTGSGPLAGADLFDLIVFRDSLPHMTRAGEALSGAVQRLRRGGWLAVRAPNRHPSQIRLASRLGRLIDPSGILHLPAQILHFDRSSLRELLGRLDLEAVAIEGESEGVTNGRGRYSRSRVADFAWRVLVAHWERSGEPEAVWGWGRRR